MVTETAAALLHAALQDLHAGKGAQAARLPALADECEDQSLADLLRREAARADEQAGRLRDAGVATAGPPNLWMGGVLDDAERDTRQTKAGRLLDIALIGAIRKGKAAEIVAAETALALAAQLDLHDLAKVVAANRNEEVATDRLLKDRLVALMS